MKPTLLVVVLVIVLATGVQLCRWQIVVPDNGGFVYRLDHLTGRVDMATMRDEWIPVGRNPLNEFGDPASK